MRRGGFRMLGRRAGDRQYVSEDADKVALETREAANSNDDGDAGETGNNHGAGIAFNITPRAGKRA